MAQWKQIWLGTMRFLVRSLASLRGLRIRCCRELWCRPAATALIRLLTWEAPLAAGAALKKPKTNKQTPKSLCIEIGLGSPLQPSRCGYFLLPLPSPLCSCPIFYKTFRPVRLHPFPATSLPGAHAALPSGGPPALGGPNPSDLKSLEAVGHQGVFLKGTPFALNS